MLAIESWLFEQSWEILGVVSLLSVMVLSRFIYLHKQDRYPFRALMIRQLGSPRSSTYVIFLTGIIVFLGFLRFEPNPSISTVDLFKLLIGFLMLLVFALSQGVFILSIDEAIPLSKRQRLLRNLIYSVLFFLLIKYTFLQAIQIKWVHGLAFLTLLNALSLQQKLTDIVLLGLGLVAPLLILFGLDPFWGSSFSPWVITSEAPSTILATLLLIYTVHIYIMSQRDA